MEERMEYIVLDLEWNQSNTGKEDAVEKQIGRVHV